MLDIGLLDRNAVGDLDAVIESAAYRKFYMHGTGHWLGRDVHDVGDYQQADEAPVAQPDWLGGTVVKKPSRKLEPGMVVTIEPGLYIRPAEGVPERYWNIGIRIEDDAVVTDKGCELISRGVPVAAAEIEALMRTKPTSLPPERRRALRGGRARRSARRRRQRPCRSSSSSPRARSRAASRCDLPIRSSCRSRRISRSRRRSRRLLNTAYALPYALAQPFLGPIGDRFGKPRCIQVCVAGLAVMLLLGAFAPDFAPPDGDADRRRHLRRRPDPARPRRHSATPTT